MTGRYDTIIIGGGPAGLGAAAKAAEKGLSVLLVEKAERLGGIPVQCIHPGFGIHYFHEDLTGPEFSQRLIDRVLGSGVEILTSAYVEKLSVFSPLSKKVTIISPKGFVEAEAPTIIYAAGAAEKHRYEILVPGANVAGVYTAGEAQALMDLYGIMPGRRILIVGSGDVGLIMARRFALEGAEVVGVIEMLPYPSGLTRNIVTCLEDYHIPLYLRHRLVEIRGYGRVEEALVAEVDENGGIIEGSMKTFSVDTVILAVGLKPRVRLLEEAGVLVDPATGGPMVNDYLETSIPGIFAAGNALLINDYVDYAVEQGELAADSASEYVEYGGIRYPVRLRIRRGRGIRLVVPQFLTGERDTYLYIRVDRPFEKARINVRELGLSIPYPYLRPPEMVRLRLTRRRLRGIEGDITLEVTGE